MLIFFLGFLLGVVVTYTVLEYMMFKLAESFHTSVKTKLTWRLYFFGDLNEPQ